ncbi:class I SAM-dependent methyltransferase [Brevibacillus nitrificans]|uniref:Class I SAM-dependent methyltransferase n=1 Tax=Brevibacillus nitrificans TaxID=651560 RepID=A0A3M8DQ49_9BACL|nr:class I SAM-dependent methyltransferase [Brevibacillus nitrificans]RNB90104.1 class I SAM-dependent methyltransferase [Brevibacillus nitrificans]
MKRVYNDNISIDHDSLKKFYTKRAVEKVAIDVDAPVVLCADKDFSKIAEWTSFEIENRLPLLQLNEESRVLEVGCGTGRISKFITPVVDTYVGVDYVKEFIDLIQSRDDIEKKRTTHFIHSSVQDLMNGTTKIPFEGKFNRFIISGGVFMYINDDEVNNAISQLVEKLDDECVIYLSEPIALHERLTLNKFYSESLESDYSAIYRTEKEYNEIFDILYKQGFQLTTSEEFFYEDIKGQKETKQWMFILKRNKVV